MEGREEKFMWRRRTRIIQSEDLLPLFVWKHYLGAQQTLGSAGTRVPWLCRRKLPGPLGRKIWDSFHDHGRRSGRDPSETELPRWKRKTGEVYGIGGVLGAFGEWLFRAGKAS